MSWIHDLTPLDWLMLLVLLGSVVSSFLKGFAREAVGLASVILGLLLAAWFYEAAGALFLAYVKTTDIASLIGFALIFFGTLILGTIVSFLINRLLKVTHLQGVDRVLGAGFGFVRGWLIGSVLFLILTASPIQLEAVKSAKLAPYLLIGARILVTVTPSSLKSKFMEGYEKVHTMWKEEMGRTRTQIPRFSVS